MGSQKSVLVEEVPTTGAVEVIQDQKGVEDRYAVPAVPHSCAAVGSRADCSVAEAASRYGLGVLQGLDTGLLRILAVAAKHAVKGILGQVRLEGGKQSLAQVVRVGACAVPNLD